MPKETVGSDNAGSKLVLQWGREGQLGVDLGDTIFHFRKDLDVEHIPEYNSLWFHFESRDDYNKLIRVLRRMRDAQFGKDA